MSALPVEDIPSFYETTLKAIRAEFVGFHQSGVRLGNLFATMKKQELYKEHYATFEEFCSAELKLSQQHVYRLISASEIAAEVLASHETLTNWLVTEGSLRPLKVLPKGERKAAYDEAVANTNGKPTAKAVQEAVDRRVKPSGRSIVNGVETDDPPEVAKLRAAGKLSGVPVVEVSEEPIDPADVAEEREERKAKREDDLSEEGWLVTLPLSSQLIGSPLRTFWAQALLYRDLEHARATFHRSAIAATNKRGKGPYTSAIMFFLKVDHPKKWLLCPRLAGGGCGGTGQLGILGQCPACRGNGFRINGN